MADVLTECFLSDQALYAAEILDGTADPSSAVLTQLKENVLSAVQYASSTVDALDQGVAVGSTADQSLVVQQAAKYASDQNATLQFPDGDFYCTNLCALLSPGAPLHIRETNPGRSRLVQNSNARIIDWFGKTPVLVGTFTGDVAAGSLTFTLSSVTDANGRVLAAGDYVRIASTRKWWGTDKTNPVFGETRRVKSVNTGTKVVTVYGKGLEYDWYSADTTKVYFLDFQTPSIDIGFWSPAYSTGLSWTSGAVRLSYSKDASVSARIEGFGGPGLQLDGHINARVPYLTGRDLINNQPAGQFGYLKNEGWGSGLTIGTLDLTNGRHAFTCNGHSTYGIAAHTRGKLLRATECTNAAFDTHCGGDDIHFDVVDVRNSAEAMGVRALNVSVGLLLGQNLTGPLLRLSDVTGVPDMGCHVETLRGKNTGGDAIKLLGHGFTYGTIEIDDPAGPGMYIDPGVRRVSGGKSTVRRPGITRGPTLITTGDAGIGTTSIPFSTSDAALLKPGGGTLKGGGFTLTYSGVSGNNATVPALVSLVPSGTHLDALLATHTFCQGQLPSLNDADTTTVTGAQTLPADALLVDSAALLPTSGIALIGGKEYAYEAEVILATLSADVAVAATTLPLRNAIGTTFDVSGSVTLTSTDPDNAVSETVTYSSRDADNLYVSTVGGLVNFYRQEYTTIKQTSTTHIGTVVGPKQSVADGASVQIARVAPSWGVLHGFECESVLENTGLNGDVAFIDGIEVTNSQVTLVRRGRNTRALRKMRVAITVVVASNLADATFRASSMTVTGVRPGDRVKISMNDASWPAAAYIGEEFCHTNDTVSFLINNRQGSGTVLTAGSYAAIAYIDRDKSIS